MYKCGTCDRGFPAGWKSLLQHCIALDHGTPVFDCPAGYCYERFDNPFDLEEHQDDYDHHEFECSVCPKTFPTTDIQKAHEVEDHLFCADCERYFYSLNNIKQHLNSKLHRGQHAECPFCRVCYTTAAGMTHHLERGACPNAPNLDIDAVYDIVRRKDSRGILTKKLVGYTGQPTGGYRVTGNAAWNGRAWECYLCHHGFGSSHALEQHLNSGTHRQPLYHCPKDTCHMNFKTLAAIINHLESETCGAMRFETVQRRIGDIVTGNRLLAF
ncbi:hypothetical protein B0T17DRAFT_128730 [Bombardia bombarda]|uniref:C2H2-type domain-containing protein n=1 Tax=Bombardia bombarda TaxID=252184 RepID=A0AA39WBM3_9PEZI|nr:hypothetical protein B0T17DRAFT_128730 [Bombardia bombarda]